MMFDWFDKTFRRREYITDDRSDLEKIGEDMSKVIPFPESKPVPEKPARTYYRLGLTDNNRVSFQMGYSEITMNREGCQQVIDQITFFMNQLDKGNNNDSSESTDN
jgi:hypothetical protein